MVVNSCTIHPKILLIFSGIVSMTTMETNAISKEDLIGLIKLINSLLNDIFYNFQQTFRPSYEEFSLYIEKMIQNVLYHFNNNNHPSESNILFNSILKILCDSMVIYNIIISNYSNIKKIYNQCIDKLFSLLITLRYMSSTINMEGIDLVNLIDQCIQKSLFNHQHRQEYYSCIHQIIQSSSKKNESIEIDINSIQSNRYPIKLFKKCHELYYQDEEMKRNVSHMIHILLDFHIQMENQFKTNELNNQNESNYASFYFILHSLLKNDFPHMYTLYGNNQLLKVILSYQLDGSNTNEQTLDFTNVLKNYLDNLVEFITHDHDKEVDSILFESMNSLLNINHMLFNLDIVEKTLVYIFNESSSSIPMYDQYLGSLNRVYSKLRQYSQLLSLLLKTLRRYSLKTVHFPLFWREFCNTIENLPVGQVSGVFDLFIHEIEAYFNDLIRRDYQMEVIGEEDGDDIQCSDNILIVSMLFSVFLSSLKQTKSITSNLMNQLNSLYGILLTYSDKMNELISSNNLTTEFDSFILIYYSIRSFKQYIRRHFIPDQEYDLILEPYFDNLLKFDINKLISKKIKKSNYLRSIIHRMMIQRMNELNDILAYIPDFNGKGYLEDDIKQCEKEMKDIISYLEKDLKRLPPIHNNKDSNDLYIHPMVILSDESYVSFFFWEIICNNIAIISNYCRDSMKYNILYFVLSTSIQSDSIYYQRSINLLLDAQFYDIKSLRPIFVEVLINIITEHLLKRYKILEKDIIPSHCYKPERKMNKSADYDINNIQWILSYVNQIPYPYLNLSKFTPFIFDVLKCLLQKANDESRLLINSFALTLSKIITYETPNIGKENFMDMMKNKTWKNSQCDETFSELLSSFIRSYLKENDTNTLSYIYNHIKKDHSICIIFLESLNVYFDDLLYFMSKHKKSKSKNLNAYNGKYAPNLMNHQYDQIIQIVRNIEKDNKKNMKNVNIKHYHLSLEIKRFYSSLKQILSIQLKEESSLITNDDINFNINDFLQTFPYTIIDNDTIRTYFKCFLCISSIYHQYSVSYEELSLLLSFYHKLSELDHMKGEFNMIFRKFIQNLDKEKTLWCLEQIHRDLIRISDQIDHGTYEFKELHHILIFLKDLIERISASIRYQVLGKISGDIIIQITNLMNQLIMIKDHNELIDIHMIMILYLFIQEKFIHISPRMLGTILGCIQLYITETRNISISMFLSCYHLIIASIKYRQFQSMNNIVEINKNIESLIKQTVKMNQKDQEIICSQNIARLYQELSTNKSIMKQFGVYMIIDYIRIIESESMSYEVRNTLNQGIYAMIDELDEKEMTIIMKSLNELGKTLIKQIYEKYKKEYKFDGKV